MVRTKCSFHLTLESRESLAGYMFTLPFTIGFILFFLRPFIQSVVFSVNELVIVPDGFELNFIGLKNYRYSLLIHTTFVRTFVDQVVRMVTDVPAILVFSFFAASILNQRFRGRLAARVVFFLPVILSAGVVLKLEQTDYMTSVLSAAQGSSRGLLSVDAMRDFLMQLRLPESMLTYIIGAANRLADIIKASGIQILIFLGGLQSIPQSLYEAANVEGATPWESFWKITFPMLTPLVLTNIVYTVIDSFTAANNQLVELIRLTAFGGAGYGVSTAMGCMYFLAVSIILAVVVGIVSPHVFYHE